MSWPRFNPNSHQSELILLGVIGVGVIVLLGIDLNDGTVGLDTAAFLLVLQAIVQAIKERWTQRSIDRMGDQLSRSQPDRGPSGEPEDPIHTVEEQKP